MDVGTEQGSVECPYCGHQIAERVTYTGQELYCQKCTSACTAPTYVEWLSPASLAEEEASQAEEEAEEQYRARMAPRWRAEEAELRQAEIDERFGMMSGLWAGTFAIMTVVFTHFAYAESKCMATRYEGNEFSWFPHSIFFCLFLWGLWSTLPRKYFSKEAKRRAEKRKAEGYWDNKTRSWVRISTIW